MRITVQFMVLLYTHQHKVVVWRIVSPRGITGSSSLLGSNILLSTLILKHPQPTFLPQCELPCVTPIQINRQNYISVYLNLCILRYQPGRQKIQHQMIAVISWFHSAHNIFPNRILTCLGCSQIF
jgi:hypothetical protein